MNPPKCKVCGKEEWRHTCGPRGKFGMLIISVEAMDRMSPKRDAPVIQGGKTDRKEYLKLKARERRARQKAASNG